MITIAFVAIAYLDYWFEDTFPWLLGVFCIGCGVGIWTGVIV